MRVSLSVFTMAILLMCLPAINRAQDLQGTLQSLSDAAAKAYLNPASNGFGADLNSGWFSRAPQAKILGLDVQVGVVAMGAFMPEDNKNFSINGNIRFTRSQAEQLTQSVANQYGAAAQQDIVNQIISRDFYVGISGPTVIGSKNEYMQVEFDATTLYYQGQPVFIPQQVITLQDINGVLDNTSLLPFGAPQLSLGTVYGTQVTFRYLPPTEVSADLGKSDYFGFGIQHNIGVWIPFPLPVDISLGFFTQKLKVGDVLESTANEYGIFASRTFGPGTINVTPYAGLSFQNATMKVSYNYNYTTATGTIPTNVSFELDGENSTKLAIGVAFKLSIVNLNIDYNIAKYSTLSGGLGLIF